MLCSSGGLKTIEEDVFGNQKNNLDKCILEDI